MPGHDWGRGSGQVGERATGSRWVLLAMAVVSLNLSGSWAWAQAEPPASVPGIPSTAASKTIAPEVMTAPTLDNPEATAAEASGPIEVLRPVSDESVERKLRKLLPRYPGVRSVSVDVEEGVVTLTGHVADKDTRDRVRDFVRRVQGVNLVLNQMKTDIQMLSAQDYALAQLRTYGEVIQRKWLLVVLAVLFFLASCVLARLFKRYGDALLYPFTHNILLRSVLASVTAGLIMVCGALLALSMMGMSEAVLSFLGLAGVVALAVGFAFRDIVENFIASVMLGIRRPFRMGDVIEVAGRSGVVRSLNTRATVLVTFDGSQVRIPNAIIFKEVMVNRSASTSVRGSFDMVIPWEASVATATEAITRALKDHEGFEADPPPRTLLDSVDPSGVRLRSYFWFPSRGVDGQKLMSDAQLAAKVALQKVGIRAAPSPLVVQMGDRRPAEAERGSRGSAREIAERQVEHNLGNDSRAASLAAAQRPEDQENEIEHALDVAQESTLDEGRNLMPEGREPSEANAGPRPGRRKPPGAQP